MPDEHESNEGLERAKADENDHAQHALQQGRGKLASDISRDGEGDDEAAGEEEQQQRQARDESGYPGDQRDAQRVQNARESQLATRVLVPSLAQGSLLVLGMGRVGGQDGRHVHDRGVAIHAGGELFFVRKGTVGADFHFSGWPLSSHSRVAPSGFEVTCVTDLAADEAASPAPAVESRRRPIDRMR